MGSGTLDARSILPPPVAAFLGLDRRGRTRRGLLAGRTGPGWGPSAPPVAVPAGRRRAVWGRLRRAGALGRRRAGRIRAPDGLPSLPPIAFRSLCARPGGEELAVGGVRGLGSRTNVASDRAIPGDSGRVWTIPRRFRALRARVRGFLLPIGGRCPLARGLAGVWSCSWMCSEACQLLRRRPAGAVRGGEGRIRTRSAALAGVRSGGWKRRRAGSGGPGGRGRRWPGSGPGGRGGGGRGWVGGKSGGGSHAGRGSPAIHTGAFSAPLTTPEISNRPSTRLRGVRCSCCHRGATWQRFPWPAYAGLQKCLGACASERVPSRESLPRHEKQNSSVQHRESFEGCANAPCHLERWYTGDRQGAGSSAGALLAVL